MIPEVAALGIPGDPDGRVVLLIRIEESMDAPHEVHVTSTPEIPVRRGDNTEPAGLDDVERMVYRRDRIGNAAGGPLVPDFFQGAIGPDQFHDPNTMGYPPTVAISLRPRRVASPRFDFSWELDNKIEELAMKHQLVVYQA